MKYVPLATLLLTAPLLSQDAVRVEDQRAIGLEDTSDPRYLGPPLRVPVVTYQQLRMLRAAGLSATEEDSASRWSALQLPMLRAIGFGPLERTPELESSWVFFGTTPTGVEYSAISIPWPEAMAPAQPKDDSGRAERLDLAQAVEVEESSNGWTTEQLPMQRAAGFTLDDFIDVPDVREREASEDSSYTAEKLRMQKAAGIGELEQSDTNYTAEKLRMQRAAGIGELEQSDTSYTAERLRMQRAAGIGPLELTPELESSWVFFGTTPSGVEYSAINIPWPQAMAPAQPKDDSGRAEQLDLAQAVEVEESSNGWTARQLPMQRAAGFGLNDFIDVPEVREREASEDSSHSAEKLRMQRAVRVQANQSSDEDSSGSKVGAQPYPFESPAEKLARLRAERLGRDAAKAAVQDLAHAIAVRVSPSKVEIQALAEALQPIGFEEFADELDRTEPTLIIDYWFPRLWTRVLDHQLTRSVEGLEATQGARELFIDVRQLLREREAVTRDSQTHQRLNELLNAAEVAGTDSREFQEFQVEWTKVRMQRAIRLAHQDRERSGLVSPTVRQRLVQLRGELDAIRATDQ